MQLEASSSARETSARADRTDASIAQISTERRTIMRLLVAASIVMIGAGVAVAVLRLVTERQNMFGLIPLFDLDGDGNLAAVFSAILLLGASIVSFANAGAGRDLEKGRARHWRFLAFAFLVMTVDELAGLHELLDRPAGLLVGSGGLLTFAWVVPAVLFVLILAVAYIPFLTSVPRDIAVRILVAGAVYVLGAVGLDAVSGAFWETGGRESVQYMVASVAEEAAEVVGLLLFIDAGLRLLARREATVGMHWTIR